MIKKILNSGIFWTVVVGLIGIGLTVLFYEYSNKERAPVYSVKKEPSIIFDKNNSSPKIKLLSNDSIVIEKNVYITSLVLWNNGDLEINKEDLRKNFEIKTKGNVEILDYSIVNQTHPDISKFRIKDEGNSLKIDWDFFDPKFGFELQVIYAGDNESEILIDGYVLGAEIKKVTSRKKNSIIGYFIAINLLAFIYFFITFIKRLIKDKRDYSLWVMVIFMGGMIVFMSIYIYIEMFRGYELPL